MIKKKTVFILGAGASLPYNYPLGLQLLMDICDSIQNTKYRTHTTSEGSFRTYDEPFQTMINTEIGGLSKWKYFASTLRGSHIPSVDSFLEARSEFMEFGKIAIAAQLVICEDPNYLVRGNQKNNNHSDHRWYDYLYTKVGTKSKDFEDPNFSIITFNYDRSFEYFYYKSLYNSFGEENAIDLFEQVPIVHFYGILDEPHFVNSEDGRKYGEIPKDIQKTANKLSLISDRNEVTDEVEKARAQISAAEQIIFLGFGYHPENIRRLFSDTPLQNGCHVHGTAFGMKRGEYEPVRDAFRNIYKITAYLNETSILGFLREQELYAWDYG